MQADPRSGAGGVITAPRHQAERQAVTTAGTNTLPQATIAHQGADVCWLAEALARRHLIPLSHARVFAEAVRP
jgi:hypothetical protein